MKKTTGMCLDDVQCPLLVSQPATRGHSKAFFLTDRDGRVVSCTNHCLPPVTPPTTQPNMDSFGFKIGPGLSSRWHH